MSGEDALNLPLSLLGQRGTISVTANVVPGLMLEHMATALAGDFGTAAKQHHISPAQ